MGIYSAVSDCNAACQKAYRNQVRGVQHQGCVRSTSILTVENLLSGDTARNESGPRTPRDARRVIDLRVTSGARSQSLKTSAGTTWSNCNFERTCEMEEVFMSHTEVYT
jgi:hypothetical protein